MLLTFSSNYVKRVLCHHGMARPQIADGGTYLCIWRVAANILNKQWQKADKLWLSSLGVGRGSNNSHRKNQHVTKCYTVSRELDLVGGQEVVRWDKGDTEPADYYTFFY
jgi:hypothetical protein